MWALVFSNEKLRSTVIKLAVALVALCMTIALMLSIKAQAFKDGVATERARQEKQSALAKQQKENIENTANENWQEKQKEALNDERILVLAALALNVTACSTASMAQLNTFPKAPAPTVAISNSLVTNLGHFSTIAARDMRSWNDSLHDVSSEQEYTVTALTLFKSSVLKYTELAEVADKQADQLRLWKKYGQSVTEFNKQ